MKKAAYPDACAWGACVQTEVTPTPSPDSQVPGRLPRARTQTPYMCIHWLVPWVRAPLHSWGSRRPPSSHPRPPAPAAGPSFCNSCISFTGLYISRGFQNTLGLFTELCKNILSPLQLSLPEGSGTCPSLSPCWANSSLCQQRPGLLKGTAAPFSRMAL